MGWLWWCSFSVIFAVPSLSFSINPFETSFLCLTSDPRAELSAKADACCFCGCHTLRNDYQSVFHYILRWCWEKWLYCSRKLHPLSVPNLAFGPLVSRFLSPPFQNHSHVSSLYHLSYLIVYLFPMDANEGDQHLVATHPHPRGNRPRSSHIQKIANKPLRDESVLILAYVWSGDSKSNKQTCCKYLCVLVISED